MFARGCVHCVPFASGVRLRVRGCSFVCGYVDGGLFLRDLLNLAALIQTSMSQIKEDELVN